MNPWLPKPETRNPKFETNPKSEFKERLARRLRFLEFGSDFRVKGGTDQIRRFEIVLVKFKAWSSLTYD
jgi:hypothetical protein